MQIYIYIYIYICVYNFASRFLYVMKKLSVHQVDHVPKGMR